MKHARLGRFAAFGAVVALALPVQRGFANEVTKWNEIAVNTVNAPTSRRSFRRRRPGAVS